jgi:Flp pilus assembly protein TadG
MFFAKMMSATRRYLRDKSGVAAIEFAALGGVMCMLLVVGADLGMAFYSDMQVQTSAQAGAEYAAVHGYDASAVANAVATATSSSGISSSPAPVQFCGCPGASGVASATCGTACPDGMSAGTYVTVSATRTYTTLVPYPGFPATYVQNASSTVRVQ